MLRSVLREIYVLPVPLALYKKGFLLLLYDLNALSQIGPNHHHHHTSVVAAVVAVVVRGTTISGGPMSPRASSKD